MWDWKVRVRVREFDVGGGESVEVRVFLVPARELYEEEVSVLSPSGTSTKTRDPSPTSMLPQTDSFLTLPNTASSNRTSTSSNIFTSSTPTPSASTPSISIISSNSVSMPAAASTPTTNVSQPTTASTASQARNYGYDHPGYVGCVGTFVNELGTAEMCGNCMARRRLGSRPTEEDYEESGEEERREVSVVQGTVYLSERIVEEMSQNSLGEQKRGEGMKGLEPDVVLPFLRERLRWGVWTVRTSHRLFTQSYAVNISFVRYPVSLRQVSNNAPIPFESLAPGVVEVDVCATRLTASEPASRLRSMGERDGAFPEVGETVWYAL